MSRTDGLVKSSHAMDALFFSPPERPRFAMSPITKKESKINHDTNLRDNLLIHIRREVCLLTRENIFR